VIAVMPADHYVAPNDAFQRTLRDAITLAAASPAIVLIGVKPTRPETGFGYQKLGPMVRFPAGRSRKMVNPLPEERTRIATASAANGFKLDAFIEKPSVRVAEKMMRSSKYLWNAGMFIMCATTLAAEFERHAPPLAAAMRSLAPMGPAQLAIAYR